MRAAWRKAWALAPTPFEEVAIPFSGTTLPGLFAPLGRGGERAAVLVELSGSDHINERTFFRSDWRKFHNRGVSYFTLEGPGQGEPLRLRRMALRPDYDKVAAAALDYLATRPDVDMHRVGVFGTAFGGYFAAQAGVDPRVRAVACRSASFDLWEDAYRFSPPVRGHLEYMLGVEGEEAARRALAPFTLTALAPRIRAPIAIYHGGRDDVQDPRGAQRLYDAIPPGQKILKIPPDGPRNVGRELELELVDWLIARIG
jgi:dienelactone hydrolase